MTRGHPHHIKAGYALLRAVWANDPLAFESVYRWTRANLAHKDHLFAWQGRHGGVSDPNAATDADTDVALDLRFDLDPSWERELHLTVSSTARTTTARPVGIRAEL